MPNEVLSGLRAIVFGAVALFCTPVLAQSFVVDYSTSSWSGGSIDSDSDGLPDYCIQAPRNPDKNFMMFAMTKEGLILMLVNPLWGMDETGGSIEVDIVVEGFWQGKLTGQIADTDTVALVIKDNASLVEAIKLGSYFHAFTYIGDFSARLSGSRAALENSEQCFAREIQPLLAKTPVAPETAQDNTDTPPVSASYKSGKVAYDNKDYLTAMALWQEAAMSGDAEAINGLGILSRYGFGVPKDLNQARSWYLMAAEMGLDRAQYNLGRLYDKGLGVKVDFVVAMKWYIKSADQGYDRAQNSVGIKFGRGEGVPKDAETARKWFSLAANNGSREAQFNLATYLRTGRGGPADPVEAIQWYRRSAEQGFALAQLRLGDALANGNGAPVDRIEAYKWYLLAQKNGNEKAVTKLKDLDTVLSQPDKVRATSMAATWQKSAELQTRNTEVKPAPADPVRNPIFKTVPDDLFGALAPTKSPVKSEPALKPAVRAPVISVEGCFDLSQSQTQCLQACDSAEFSAKYAGSHIVFKLRAGADVAACHELCGAAAVGFDTAQNNVAVLADTKFFCPMLFSEAAFLLKKNGVPRTYGDKSLMGIEADAFAAFWKATRRKSTPDARAVLTTTPYPAAVKQMLDAMPAKLDGCYDTTGALQICLGKCESMKTISVAGLPAGALFNACTFGCDVASRKFNDSFIWTKELTDQGEYGGVCDRIHFGSKDIAVDEIKNETRALGFGKKETSAAIRGLREFWGTAHSLGVR